MPQSRTREISDVACGTQSTASMICQVVKCNTDNGLQTDGLANGGHGCCQGSEDRVARDARPTPRLPN